MRKRRARPCDTLCASMSKKSVTPSPELSIDRQRAAERELNEALDTAKRLKAKARDAKRRVKGAKKAAKQASKAARAARKAAEEARRAYKKTVERAAKDRKKVAKARQPIATPNRTTPSRNAPRSARKRERRVERAGAGVWDVGEESLDVETAESPEASSDIPV